MEAGVEMKALRVSECEWYCTWADRLFCVLCPERLPGGISAKPGCRVRFVGKMRREKGFCRDGSLAGTASTDCCQILSIIRATIRAAETDRASHNPPFPYQKARAVRPVAIQTVFPLALPFQKTAVWIATLLRS
jgi:hypothetical protein